jgi:hypothetical protein
VTAACATAAVRRRLEALVAAHPERRRAGADAVELDRTPYEPWWAQRQLHRPRALSYDADAGRLTWNMHRFRVAVCARQTGKTHAGANELVQTAMAEPGSYSALLAPTYQIARAAIDKVQQVCVDLGLDWADMWREQKKRLTFPNGSVWSVFSADRKETVRGPTITGILWIDEAAFLNQAARDAAYGALTGNMTARVLITTTPKGLNWVYQEFTADNEDTLRLRFRSVDSPYTDKRLVERMRQSLSAEMYAQEFEAVFVQSLLLPFPPEWRAGVWVDEFASENELRKRPKLATFLGIDLDSGASDGGTKASGDAARDKEAQALANKDWTRVTLCNELGELTPLAGWQGERWPEATRRIADLAKAHDAIPVVEVGGPGGGAGVVLADYLERDFGLKVARVKIGNRGTKGAMVEQLRADGQWGRVRILRNEHHDSVDHELGVFQGRKTTYQGREIQIYEGPQIPGEHDDWVLSLCLANWGRYVTEARPDPTQADFSAWAGDMGATARRQHNPHALSAGSGQHFGGFGAV